MTTMDEEVTPSCGCVLCDLNLALVVTGDKLMHQDRAGGLAPCTKVRRLLNVADDPNLLFEIADEERGK